MPELKDLATNIATTWEAMKAKNDEMLAAAKRGEELHAEDKAALAQMNADMTAFKKQMDEMALRGARAEVVKPGEKSGAEAERDKAYDGAFFKWFRKGSREMAADDMKVLNTAMAPERKALVEDATGGYLIPEQLEAEIIRAIPQINTIRQYCRVIPTSRDKIAKRNITEVAVGHGKLETGAAVSETNVVPSKDYIYVEDVNGLVKIGRDELADSDANLQAILIDSLSVAFANDEAKMIAVGRGHSYEEQEGLAVDATIIASYKGNWTTADTAIPDDMITCKYGLEAQYRNGAVWIMHSQTEAALRLYRPAVASGYYGNYLWQPSLQIGTPNNFDGYPIINQDDMHYAADAVAGINVLLGNPRLGYAVLTRQGMMIQRLDEVYATAGLVGFLATWRVGGGVLRPAAFHGIYNNT